MSSAAACVPKAAAPSIAPTTRFVPAARRTSSPTERTSAGIRRVPRITPTAPPIAPIAPPKSAAGATLGRARSTGRIGRRARSTPLHSNTSEMIAYRADRGTSSANRAPATAPTTDGGAIHATIRQSTRPSRT